MNQQQRGNAAGLIITILLVLALVGLGGWLVFKPGGSDLGILSSGAPTGSSATTTGRAPQPIEPASGMPTLAPAAPYEPKNGVVEMDISEYAGYAGLIVANGGLAPNPDSFFAKHYGFQVKLTLSEGENWSQLNNGQFAASATTTDVLAALGRQFQVVVPAQIGFSRGADMVVVDSTIASVNQLKGKVLAAAQFNESEFFIRYLAQEAGLPVHILRDLDTPPAADAVNLVFYQDAFVACDGYQAELNGSHRLAGCVGWSPRTDEVVANSNGAAKILTSNRNLLVIADILTVNKGFAQAHPEMVKGLVHGLIEGNRLVREQPAAYTALVAKALNWDEAETRQELTKVHLVNLPESLAFFNGTIDAAGSFSGIFQSSVLAYGPSIIPNPADADRFADLQPLEALQTQYANQKVAIAPIRHGNRQAIEGDPLLSKDIRFFFEPNSSVLDKKAPQNQEYLETIRSFLQVSPGSVVVLRGHVDNARVDEFRQKGGEGLVRSMALKAMELSKERAQAVLKALLEKYPAIEKNRLEVVGRGWEEPAGSDSDMNRRVEVQWFTLE